MFCIRKNLKRAYICFHCIHIFFVSFARKAQCLTTYRYSCRSRWARLYTIWTTQAKKKKKTSWIKIKRQDAYNMPMFRFGITGKKRHTLTCEYHRAVPPLMISIPASATLSWRFLCKAHLLGYMSLLAFRVLFIQVFFFHWI